MNGEEHQLYHQSVDEEVLKPHVGADHIGTEKWGALGVASENTTDSDSLERTNNLLVSIMDKSSQKHKFCRL